jgi:hypothetical protein
MTKADRAARARIARARQAVRMAVDRACIARGEMQFLSGYRAGAQASLSETEDRKLYDRAMAWCKAAGKAEDAVMRALVAYGRAVRKAGR